jgi:hypothetical protein
MTFKNFKKNSKTRKNYRGGATIYKEIKTIPDKLIGTIVDVAIDNSKYYKIRMDNHDGETYLYHGILIKQSDGCYLFPPDTESNYQPNTVSSRRLLPYRLTNRDNKVERGVTIYNFYNESYTRFRNFNTAQKAYGNKIREIKQTLGYDDDNLRNAFSNFANRENEVIVHKSPSAKSRRSKSKKYKSSKTPVVNI